MKCEGGEPIAETIKVKEVGKTKRLSEPVNLKKPRKDSMSAG